MCNWKLAGGILLGLPGLAVGALADSRNKQAKNARAAQSEASNNMARSQAIQDQLNTKTRDLQSTLGNEQPVQTAQRVLDPNATKKQTIKSLNIPLNAASSGGTGLNV